MTRKGRIFLIAAGAGLALLGALVYLLLRTEEDAKRRRAAATAETTAVQNLKDVAACQQGYSTVYGDYASSFPQLAEVCYLIQGKFAGESPVVGGYAFRMEVRQKTGDGPGFFSVRADPQPAPGDYGGELHFYTDSDVGNIRQNADRPATPADRPRE